MRRFMVGSALAVCAMLARGVPAQGQFYQQRPARVVESPSVNHISAQRDASSPGSFAPTDGQKYPGPPAQMKPRITRAPQSAPAAPAPTPPVAPPARNSDSSAGRNSGSDRRGSGNHHHHHHQGGGWPVWGGYPLVWVPGYTSGFGAYDPYYASYPQPGFGIAGQQQQLPQVQAPAPADPAPDPAPAAKRKVRATNAEWKAKAGKFIGFGDTNFGKQSYLAAAERYRTAAQMAPDLADPYLRQGIALVAMGQYESAAKAFRRGLRIQTDWANSPFRLDQIYGDDKIAKTAHLENLAKAVEANPLDADLLLVMGLELYFDGQQQRAGVFFARAAQLGGNDDRLLDDFLPRPGPADAAGPNGAQPDGAPRAGKKVVF